MTTPVLLERADERRRIARALEGALIGDGRVVLAEGQAGIGKSALLREARETARERGLRILSATASELDRSFAFGLVHQLLDSAVRGAGAAEREKLLAGAGGEAAVVFSGGGATGDDPSYAVLHGLYWLVVALAEEEPLALFVDDLHWGDRPSLRFLEFLGRRLDGVPVAIVATTRPHEPGADQVLLRALADGPSAEVLRPAALSLDAATEVVAQALERSPEPEFAQIMHETTGGNPLLLREVAQEAAAGGVQGRAQEAGQLAELAGRGLASFARRRLDGLGDDAVALARAAAVLSDRGRLHHLAALAGLTPDAAREAGDRLVATGLLEPATWGFAHPLLRAAVAEATPPAERSRLHRLAADRVLASGGGPAEAALHVLATEPAGDEAVVAMLRQAAHEAGSAGAPDVAVTQLRRALAEPPPADEVAELLLELGEFEVLLGDASALDDLAAALDLGLTGDAAARARAARVGLLLLSDPAAALPETERALADAEDPALRLRLEALQLETSALFNAFAAPRQELLAAARADASASSVALAHLAFESGYVGAPRAESVDFGRRALNAGAVTGAGPSSNTVNLLAHGLRYAEDPELSRAVLEEIDLALARSGGAFAALYAEHSWAYWHQSFGSVATAAAFAQSGLEKVRALGLDLAAGAFQAVLSELLLEQDRLEEAVQLADAMPAGTEATIVGPFTYASRGLVRLRQARRADAAEQDLRLAAALLDERGWRSPRVSGARLRLVELLAATGRGEEAEAIAVECVGVARAAGLTGALGASLRVQGLAAGGERGLELLAEAAKVLAGTPLVLERGRAELDLGAALRRAGRRSESREPLKRALDAADTTDSVRLGRLAREELVAAGGRARRAALSGPAALTPSERRVAELAAQGLTNRQVAENLWVTRKTVELHLSNAYGKLGIQARAQLAGALGGVGAREAVALPS